MLKRTSYLKGRIGWQGLTSEEYESAGDFALVTGTEFQEGRVDWDRCWFVDKERYDEDPYIQLQNDDLLITKDGTIGKIAHVDCLPKPATLNSGVFVLRPIKNIFIPRFMYWALRSDLFPQFIEYSKVGTTIAHLYQKTFEQFLYPVPTIAEQEHIADYLDKRCAVIDKVLESKREQLMVLDELQKSIIHHAITKGLDKNVELTATGVDSLGKIPAGWVIERIKDVAEIITGNTPPKDDPDNYDNGTFPWIKPDQLRGERVSDSDEKLSEKGADLARIVPEDAVLIGCIGDVGNFAVSGCPVTTNQQINSLVFCGKVYKPIAKYLVEVARDEHKKHATLVVVPILNKSRQGQIYLVISPWEQQVKINEYLDAKTEAIRNTRINIEQQIETLEKYRVSLIHECVTGKRRITEKDLKELANV